MIQIYSAGNENFHKNGDAVLFCYSCDLQVELNGTWVLDLEAPIDAEGRWKLITEEAVLKVPTWQDDEQLYRISRVQKTEDGVSAIAYPIFYDSSNDCFLIDCRPTGKNGQQALNIMVSGSPYSAESNITSTNTAYFVRRNLLSAINGNESPTFIERWGGEILYDNYKVIINTRVGGDYGVEARYGRNIEGVTYIVDTQDIITRIVPVAYNGYTMSGSTPWVDSTHINNYAKVYTKEAHYENIRMAEDASGADDDVIVCSTQAELDAALRTAAEADFADGCDTPSVTIDVDMAIVKSMAQLYTDTILDSNGDTILDTEGEEILSVWYRNYASLETVRLGDTIRCRHYKLDITTAARVVALTWDCCNKKVTHVTLGDYQYNYVKSISTAVNRIGKVVRDDGTVIAERVQGFLDGAQTQLRTQYNLAEKQDVMAILFENLDEESSMYGALGIGTQGICISKTRTSDGRDWDWSTGITANGINASVGVFGILADKLGKNWINLDTGEISLSNTSTIGGKTINQYMDDASEALENYQRSTDDALAYIQSQLDGQIDSYFYNYTPTLSNYPASEWTTDDLKKEHEGDLFYNKSDGSSYRFLKNDSTGQYEWTLITDTVATQALQLAATAKDTADGKRRVFAVTPYPPYDPGDIYFTGDEIRVCVTGKETGSYAESDFVRKDNYTGKTEFNQFVLSYTQTIKGLQDDLDDRIEMWQQTTDPSSSWTTDALKSEHKGDIWYNPTTGLTKYWTGSAWSEMTATPPASVITTINGKAVIFTSQPKPPYRVGDLWFDSASAEIMTCMTERLTGNYTSTDWVKRNKYTDDSALNAYKEEISQITDDLQNQLDGKVQTYRQSTDPSIDWTGIRTDYLQDTSGQDILDENSEQIETPYEYEKIIHIGDLWYNTTDNTQWRWTGAEWEPITISDELFDKFDAKRTIYGAQPVPPYQINDLWVQGSTGDILVCRVEREDGESFNANDWQLASKYTDDSALLSWIQGDYADTIQELKSQADGKAETWYQSAEPSTSWSDDDKAVHKGDLWYNTTNDTTWFWDGTAWKQQNVPKAVFDEIDTKAQIFANQPTIPYYKNDIWFTGTDILVAVNDRTSGAYTASDWQKKDYYTDDQALEDFIKNDFAEIIKSVRNQIDQKIETWHQKTDPSLAWTGTQTDILADTSGEPILDTDGNEISTVWFIEAYEHTGDIWQNATDNTQWRWTGGGWEPMSVPDAFIDLVDGKATVFVGTKTPDSPNEKDLWFKGVDEGIFTYINGVWVEYNKYTDDENLFDFVENTYEPKIEEIETKAEATFQLLQGEIIAKVVAGKIVQAINLSKEGLQIDVSLMNINGVVSANNYFKINSDGSFETIKGKIGNVNIVSNAIYSGSHSAYNSSNAGFYLGDTGIVGIGDSNSYFRYNPNNGGSLNIKATSVLIGDDSAATQTALRQVSETASENFNAAKSAASSAQSAAEGAQTTANNAQTSANNAAKTATNFLYYSASDGLVISATGGTATASGSSSKPYNTQIKGDGIYFRNGTRNLSYISGSNFTIYRPGSSNVKSMELLSNGLYFYKLDGNTVASKFTDNGLEIALGKVGGFTIDSKAIYLGALGADNSVYVSSGTSASASIGGSSEISGWAFAAGKTFGVTKNGNVYLTSGKIAGVTITNGSIYSGSKSSATSSNAGFYLGSDGQFVAGGSSQYIKYDGTNLTLNVNYLSIKGTAAATETDVSNAQSTANRAIISASAAQSTADGAQTSANNAAKTATNYLYYSNSAGLVVSTSGTASSGYNVQITSSAVNIRHGNTTLAELTDSRLTFYKPGTTTVSAYFGSDGLQVYSGIIGGFTALSDSLTCSFKSSNVTYGASIRKGTLTGHRAFCITRSENGSLTYPFYVLYDGSVYCANLNVTTGSSKSDNANGSISLSTSDFSRTIGGSSTSNLRFAIGSKFGVTNSGVVYSSQMYVGDRNVSNQPYMVLDSGALAFRYSTRDLITITAVDSYTNYEWTQTGSGYEQKASGTTNFSTISSRQGLVIRPGTFFSIAYPGTGTYTGNDVLKIKTSGLAVYKGTHFWGKVEIGDSTTYGDGDFTYTKAPNLYIYHPEYSNHSSSMDVLYVNSSGNVRCTNISTGSSKRYKNIGRNLTKDDVERAYSIRPVIAEYKPGHLRKDHYWNGVKMPMLIAEDIEEKYPKAVKYNDDGDVDDYDNHMMIAIHQQMLIDQREEIKSLKETIKQLKNLLTEMVIA